MLEQLQKQRSQQEQREREELYMNEVMPKILSAYPWIVDCLAVRNMLIEACDGDPFKVDLYSVGVLFEETGPRSLRSMLNAPVSLADQKGGLIQEILSLLARARDSYSLQVEAKRLQYFDLQALKRRKQEILDAQAAVGKTATEIRNEIRASRPEYRQYAEIPEEYVPPGKNRPFAWTQALLRKLAPMELRRLIRIYGAETLNETCRRGTVKGEK